MLFLHFIRHLRLPFQFVLAEIQGEDSHRTMVGTSAFTAVLDAVGAQFVYRMALVRAGGFAVEPR